MLEVEDVQVVRLAWAECGIPPPPVYIFELE